jgi:FAD/FMN-containing dehydrogenase
LNARQATRTEPSHFVAFRFEALCIRLHLLSNTLRQVPYLASGILYPPFVPASRQTPSITMTIGHGTDRAKTNSNPSCNAAIKSKATLAISYFEDHPVPFISPRSPTWATDTVAYNLRVPAAPALVVYAQTVEHVQNAVNCGAACGLKVSARGGGHSYTSLGLGGENDHLVVDLTHFNSISVDRDTHVATIGAGARLGDVARELFDNGGRAISHGSCPAVGLSGHILHGGYGWASHSHGLALDWMIGADLVLADGRHVHCSETENSELFWALRGAGSNFGIVISYELATFAAPAVSTPFKVSLAWRTEAEKIDGVTALVEFARDMPANLNMRCK